MKNYLSLILLASALIFGNISYAIEPNHGAFMVVKGTIRIQKMDNQFQTAKVGSDVATGDTIISEADSRGKIVMSDRNVINISPLTKLKIEKYASGVNKSVELSLTDGKVRTKVEQEYDGEKTKFLIKTPTAVAGVRGTEFITSYDAKTKVTEIITLKGQVALTSLATTSTVLINKGEETSMKKDQSPDKPKPASTDRINAVDRETGGLDVSKEPKDAKDPKNGKSPGVDSRDKDPTGVPGAGGAVTSDPTQPLRPPGTLPPPPPATPRNNSTGTTKVKVEPK